MTECLVVLVTVKDEAEAFMIAQALVEKKLAACCNIMGNVRSIYRWEGALQDDREVLMLIKARRDVFAALEGEIKKLHSYSTPEIIGLPITAGSEAYLNWIEKSASLVSKAV